MQKTVYICDYEKCGEVIGSQAHVSLRTQGGDTGIAVPPKVEAAGYGKDMGGWRVVSFGKHFLHFHVKCIGPFFKDQESRALGKPQPKKK